MECDVQCSFAAHTYDKLYAEAWRHAWRWRRGMDGLPQRRESMTI